MTTAMATTKTMMTYTWAAELRQEEAQQQQQRLPRTAHGRWRPRPLPQQVAHAARHARAAAWWWQRAAVLVSIAC